MDLLKDDKFKAEELTISSISQLREIQRAPSNRAKFRVMKVSDGKTEFEFFTRNIADLARELFEDPQFAQSTALGFQLDLCEGTRVYGEFWTGDWFKSAQEFVGPTAVPIGVILYLDEKRVAIKNQKKLYPVYISLGNHSFEARQRKGGKRLLGYIPVLENGKDRRRVLHLHQACLQKMTRPLKSSVNNWLE